MTTRTTIRARLAPALVLVGALVLSGCTASADSDVPQDPADLTRFSEQDLDFGSCEGMIADGVDEALLAAPIQCAALTVPLDYSEPAGDTLELAVSRLQSTGDERIGSLVLNPGGPGGPGLVQTAVAAASWSETAIPGAFDIVGLDPRGVGASEPAVSCFTDAERDAGEDTVTLLGTSGEWTEDDTTALVDRCAEGSGGEDVLASLGTRNAARDLDVLRAALGDEQLTFAGQSYGTRLGAVYAEMFPDRVRAMVLDGAIDPSAGTAERRLELHAGFQRSFDRMAASCAEQADCPLGTDPAEATTVFSDLVRPLLDEPVPAGDGRELSFAQATGGVTSGLYDVAVWPVIIEGIRQLADERRGDLLLEITDVFGGRSADGVWNNQTEAAYAINCNDEERRTPEQEAALRAQIDEASPFMSTGQDYAGVSRDGCESWPVEPSLGFPYADDVEGIPDVLVVSITGDPVTPFAGGAALADALGGTVLEVEGDVHTVAQAGISPCVNDIVASYLIEAELPDGELACAL